MQVNPYLRRMPVLGALRDWLRAVLFQRVQHVVNLEGTRRIFARELQRQNLLVPPEELLAGANTVPPYRELRRVAEAQRPDRALDPIFITARFRTGSTLAWNLFRHLPDTTAYFEPFNERRWFDPRTRGNRVDPAHLKVSEYWSEYDGLDDLGVYFNEKWRLEQLYMPAHAWNPSMQRYIEILLERARGRAVLQFNEVDMRLAWLRAKFPAARILHLFRHPRDQWCSTLQSAASQSIPSLRVYERMDSFYLLPWGRDLCHYFPLLTLDENAHPYELFYQLWKLSYLFGRFHADYSLAFEELVADPRGTIRELLAVLGVERYDLDMLAGLVCPVRLGAWKQSPDAARFESIEARVDATFARYAPHVAHAARDQAPHSHRSRGAPAETALATETTLQSKLDPVKVTYSR